jgi:predicted dehydrogenase
MSIDMARLKVGIIGGGLIAQVEHLPNLLDLPQLFEVAGVVDPSPSVRAHIAQRWSVAAFETAEALFALPLDGVVIATPDCYHAELAVTALQRGLHVFTEKPLCYAPEQADPVIEARDQAGRVVQVGTMKRFDPSIRLLRELVAGQGERLRYISVEVNDPDFWPFVAHTDYLAADDVPSELIADAKDRMFEQISAVLGRDPAPLALKGYAKPFCSSLVHDVNLVHGLLDSMGLATGEVAGAAFFTKSEGGQAAVRLKPGGALWSMSHVAVPHLADYLERVSLFFDDRIFELQFPSPYLNHQPTRLIEKVSEGHHAQAILHRASYLEPFVEELKAWWRAIVEGTPVENSLEEAKRDVALLAAMGRVAAGSGAG